MKRLRVPGRAQIKNVLPGLTEHAEQCAVIEWAQRLEGRYPAMRWLYAVPNGGHRHPAVAARLKEEGVKPGISDLCLPCPAGRYHGAYIELKKPGGRLSPAQRDFLKFVKDAGYFTAVCYSSIEAIEALQGYVGQIGAGPEEACDA